MLICRNRARRCPIFLFGRMPMPNEGSHSTFSSNTISVPGNRQTATSGPPPEQGSTIIDARWDFPGGILRIGIIQWPKDQVDNIFLAPTIRNASDKLRSTVVTPLVVVHDQMPLSEFMCCINIELCFCIVLRTVGRADRF